MPLVNPEETIRVEFDNGDWYELFAQVGWYDAMEAKYSYLNSTGDFEEAANAVNLNGFKSESEAKAAMREKLSQSVGKTALIMNTRLATVLVRISAWSHEEEITLDNVKRIPNKQFEAIYDKIEELEGGVKEDAPFQGELETT